MNLVKHINLEFTSIKKTIFSLPKQSRVISYVYDKHESSAKENRIFINFPEIYFKIQYQKVKNGYYYEDSFCAFVNKDGVLCYPYVPNVTNGLWTCISDIDLEKSVEALAQKLQNNFWNSLFSFHMASSFYKYLENKKDNPRYHDSMWMAKHFQEMMQKHKEDKNLLPELIPLPKKLSHEFMET